MSRPVKKGLDFFPVEVSMFSDLKVRKLIKYQGGQSISIYICLLCYIYENGYFVKWDNELPFIISEKTGFEELYITDVINSCIKVDLFSESLYSNEGVLTSKGIQKRYDFICKQAKRKSEITEFSLMDLEEKTDSQQKVNNGFKVINSEETINNSEETIVITPKKPINSKKSTQSKVKESKVKENIIDFASLLSFINKTTGREFKTINEKVRRSFNARLKEGYSKSDILSAVKNSVKTDYHKSNNFQYLTPEFFSRSDTLDKYSAIKNEKAVNVEQPVISGPWDS